MPANMLQQLPTPIGQSSSELERLFFENFFENLILVF